ncbi:MAG TPA: hypothetical protein VG267_19765 [Terracidiphilus sp.]|jgi:hypothetical protein|nr:hypothetical protein [Terracidiphilus sp.]
MQFLTAAEAISPALNRTVSLLFRPFRWGTYLKLCAVAVITEGMSGNIHTPKSGVANHAPHISNGMPSGFPGELIPLLIMGGLLALVVGIVVFYLVVRLRFALFECLVHQTHEIKPGWRRYRDHAWRFFMFSIVVGILFLVVVAAALAPFASPIIHFIHQSQAEGRVDFGRVFLFALQLAPVLLCLGLAGFLLDVVMRDFMLPHFALENASAGEAWGAVWNRVAAEKGAFFLYVVLRVVLPILAMIGMFILLAIPLFIVFGILGVFIALMHASAAGGTPIGIFFEVMAGLIAFVLGVLITISLGGPLSIAVRNYALVFYGARYQVLGDALYPPMAPPAIAPAPAPLPG